MVRCTPCAPAPCGSRELVTAALADADALDPLLGVFVTRFPEQALAAAREADALLGR